MAAINFFNQDVAFKLAKPQSTARWIKEVIQAEDKELVQLNYVFCSDEYLLEINKQYLNHRSLTDIITFDNSVEPGKIEADIFISVERVQENARLLKIASDEELHRVMVHGILHLLGYSDKSAVAKMKMRKKEDACLSLRG